MSVKIRECFDDIIGEVAVAWDEGYLTVEEVTHCVTKL